MAVHSREVELLLDPARYEALERQARRTDQSLNAVVRDAIDQYLAGTTDPEPEDDVDALTPDNAPGA